MKLNAEFSVGALLAQAESRLESSNVPEARASAEFLMAAALGSKRGELRSYAGLPLHPSKRLRFRKWVSRRAKRHPLSYVLATHDFMGMELRVTPAVLIPRPETELLVETILGKLSSIRGSQFANSFIRLHILDIGTGSGCIALALARRLPQAQVIATDISCEALKVASSNARRHKLQDRISFVQADLFGEMPFPKHWADVIVSNPPYIPSRRLLRLEPEVLQEPNLALDGGFDGLKAIRAVIQTAPALLKPGGLLAMEIDHSQGARVRALMEKSGFYQQRIRADFNGLERIALGRFSDSK